VRVSCAAEICSLAICGYGVGAIGGGRRRRDLEGLVAVGVNVLPPPSNGGHRSGVRASASQHAAVSCYKTAAVNRIRSRRPPGLSPTSHDECAASSMVRVEFDEPPVIQNARRPWRKSKYCFDPPRADAPSPRTGGTASKAQLRLSSLGGRPGPASFSPGRPHTVSADASTL